MRIVIVEDEVRVAKHLEKLVREIIGSRLQQVKVCSHLEQARHVLNNQATDLLFLDLNLKGKDGFDLLQETVAESFHTIIVSAYKDQALRAFEYGVLDFIGKPFNRTRLEKALARVMVREKHTHGSTRFLAVKKQGRIMLIPVNEVMYIKAAGHYTELFVANGQKKLHDKSLDNLELLLPATFERVHRSYIINMDKVEEFKTHPGGKYQCRMQDGILLPIGRKRFKELKQKWV